MIVCVAEKPSIAKSVVHILSNGHYTVANGYKWVKNYSFNIQSTNYIMTSVAGHLFSSDFEDQTIKNWNSCQPVVLFDAVIKHQVAKDMTGIASNLEKLVRNCTELIILTDNDREGEYIGWEIQSVMTKHKRMTVRRMRFSVVQKNEIWSAFNHLFTLDNNQVEAVSCRMELDLRIGASFTRRLTLSLQRFTQDKNIISYGSCQFPTLGFVVKRYIEKLSFVSEPFYLISICVVKDTITHTFTWNRTHLFNKACVEAIYHYLNGKPCIISSIDQKQTSKWAPLPLTTVALQKAGSRLLNLSSASIMKIAEQLYQRGLISYPRTETDQFEKNFNLKDLIRVQKDNSTYKDFCIQLLDAQLYRFPRMGKNNDKAHPPIHPTGNGSNLSGNDLKVFNFIARSFLACCAKDAKGFSTTINLLCDFEAFKTSGLQVLELNYLLIYPYESWKSQEVAKFVKDEVIKNATMKFSIGNTTAPALLTEADLIGLMDTHGIGTDATMHDHISTIYNRGYAKVNGKSIVPTSLGLALVEGLDSITTDNMPLLSEPILRAELEQNLKDICNGLKTKQQVIQSILLKFKEVYLNMVNKDTSIQRIFQSKVTERIEMENVDTINADDEPHRPTNSGSGFKCYICDEPDHLANACPSKNKRKKKKVK